MGLRIFLWVKIWDFVWNLGVFMVKFVVFMVKFEFCGKIWGFVVKFWVLWVK
jgi:hypothetical protein